MSRIKIQREVRMCECNCNKQFTCKINSKQRFILGHNVNCKTEETKQKLSKSYKLYWESERGKISKNIRSLAMKENNPTKRQETIQKIKDKLSGHFSIFKGKTYYEIYGDNATEQINKRRNGLKIYCNKIRGKTCSEIYGVERAYKIIQRRKDSMQLKILNTNYHPYVHGNKKFNTGNFFSKKNNCDLFYRSSYELLAFQILESLITVASYKVNFIRIPYIFNNNQHVYIVDLYVEYIDGQKQLIEVKPKYKLNDPRTIAKLEAGKRLAEQNGMEWNVWTEDILLS